MAPTNISLGRNENKEQAVTLDVGKSAERFPQDKSSDIDGHHQSETRGASSSTQLHSMGVPANATPYVSFGEGADPVFKRVVIATHKYVYGLNSYKLLGRLHDLPEENEYVPREMYYSPVTPSHDSNATLDYTPPDIPRYTSEEIIENERIRKGVDRARELLYAYKGPLEPRPLEPRPLGDQSSTQLRERRKSSRLLSTGPQSQTKGSLHKTRSRRIDKNTGHNRNIIAGGSLSSKRDVPTKKPSPNRQPKRSRFGLNAAEGSVSLAAQAPVKSNKTHQQLSKASREPVRAQRLPTIRQEPLRASRRLAGKHPEFDMLPYEGTTLQKRDAPQQRNTNDVDLRSPLPPNRSPRNKRRPSKAAKPQGIVKPEIKPTNRARKQMKRTGS